MTDHLYEHVPLFWVVLGCQHDVVKIYGLVWAPRSTLQKFVAAESQPWLIRNSMIDVKEWFFVETVLYKLSSVPACATSVI